MEELRKLLMRLAGQNDATQGRLAPCFLARAYSFYCFVASFNSLTIQTPTSQFTTSMKRSSYRKSTGGGGSASAGGGGSSGSSGGQKGFRPRGGANKARSGSHHRGQSIKTILIGKAG